MNINRHNYEAFFLLYVDKELSAADRKAVDVFVQENPDLQMEMVLLQQTVVKADDIVLDKKDWLYREEDITALQENLLLYADDELTAADKKSVEALLAADKKAKAEWYILKQTKLQPDMAVVFTDKQSLYRKEGGRVVGFKWWRVAAAAVLLGFGLWAGVTVYKNSFKITTGSAEQANRSKTQPGQTETEVPAITTTINTASENASATDIIATTAVQENNEDQAKENIKPVGLKDTKENTVAPKENNIVQKNINKKPDNNLPKSYLENINRNGSNETLVNNVIPENNNSNNVSGNNNAAVNTNPKESTNNAVIANANKGKTDPDVIVIQVAKNTTADGENNSRYLNVDDGKGKRTAFNGFLRKAKRVLERNTNVNTGDGILIAGFEIASK